MQTGTPEKIISPAAADRLISAHDGDVALLYIYYCRKGFSDADGAALDLSRTMSEILAAEEKLIRMGLLPLDTASEQEAAKSSVDRHEHTLLESTQRSTVIAREDPVGDARPEYTAEDVRTAADDPYFSAVLQEATALIGQHLSTHDMKVLLNIYQNLSIPCEVLLMLLNYCAETNRIRYKGQRKLSTHYIEMEANFWAKQEILTVEQADEYIRRAEQKRNDTDIIATSLGIIDRPLTKSVRDCIETWLSWGFTEEVISMANDRSMAKTGKLSINYINGILDNWRKNGLLTAREINEKDPVRSAAQRKAAVNAAPGGRSTAIDLDRMKDLIDKI